MSRQPNRRRLIYAAIYVPICAALIAGIFNLTGAIITSNAKSDPVKPSGMAADTPFSLQSLDIRRTRGGVMLTFQGVGAPAGVINEGVVDLGFIEDAPGGTGSTHDQSPAAQRQADGRWTIVWPRSSIPASATFYVALVPAGESCRPGVPPCAH